MKRPSDACSLTVVLDTAASSHRRVFADPSFDGIELAVKCVTWSFPGLPDGWYRYEPAFRALRPAALGSIDPGEVLPGERDAAVSAVVIVLGALAQAVSCHGPRGHRRLLLSAGLMTAAVADAASRAAIPSTEVAQVFGQPLRDLASADGYRWAALGAVVLGRRAATTAGDVPNLSTDRLYPLKGGEFNGCSQPEERAVARPVGG